MKKEIRIIVKNKFVNRYKGGNPLILKEAVKMPNHIDDGQLVSLFDEKNQFIAKGYYGAQNKGIGWVLSKGKAFQIDESFFTTQLEKAFQYRRKIFDLQETNAFRLFNGEGDGIGGVTIDFFNGYYLINWYNLGIYAYKKYIYKIIEGQADFTGLYEKKRFNTAGKYVEDDDFISGQEPEFPLIVKESGMNYAIYLNEGAMVGIFLDQREVRKRIRDYYAKGKRVLNTFSYTAAFSVAAALGGAAETTSVDLANRSRAKTTENFEINNIDLEAQKIVVEDVFNYFKYAARKGLKFNMVILDPPSFAKSKKIIFSASKDYVGLLKNTIKITEDDGIIVASTNCSQFDMRKFQSFIGQAFKEEGKRYEILETYQLPPDFKTIDTFKEGNYLKVVFIKVKS